MLIGLNTLRELHLPDLSERWIRELVARGVIPVVKVGARILFDPVEVVAALKSHSANRGRAA